MGYCLPLILCRYFENGLLLTRIQPLSFNEQVHQYQIKEQFCWELSLQGWPGDGIYEDWYDFHASSESFDKLNVADKCGYEYESHNDLDSEYGFDGEYVPEDDHGKYHEGHGKCHKH